MVMAHEFGIYWRRCFKISVKQGQLKREITRKLEFYEYYVESS